MNNLRIDILHLGQLATNCYLAINQTTKDCFIVDPGDWASRVSERIAQLGVKPVAILLTHGHFDHVGAVEDLREKYNIPAMAHEDEKSVLADPAVNMTSMIGRGYTLDADQLLKDGQEMELAGFKVKVIHTPGHTKGSCCFFLTDENLLFSGDTLFQCSVGRTDFPTGSMSQIHNSIHQKLFVLPEETCVLPGHGEETDIRYEKRYNPY